MFVCQCGKKYSTKFNWKKHVRQKHPDDSDMQPLTEAEVEKEKVVNELRAELYNLKKENEKLKENTGDRDALCITDKVNFLDILAEKLGSIVIAKNFLKANSYKGTVEGEVEVLSRIYLDRPRDYWPIICTDPKQGNFKLLQRDGRYVEDPKGVKLSKSFRNNLVNALLTVANSNISQLIEADEAEKAALFHLDDFDYRHLVDYAIKLNRADPKTLVAALIEAYFK